MYKRRRGAHGQCDVDEVLAGLVLIEMDKHSFHGGTNNYIGNTTRALLDYSKGMCQPPATRKLRDWRKAARLWRDAREAMVVKYAEPIPVPMSPAFHPREGDVFSFA